MCCSPWGHKESDMTELLNNNKFILVQTLKFYSLNKFQSYNAALSTIVTVLYIRYIYPPAPSKHHSILRFYEFNFLFFFGCVACGILVPPPGIKPASPALIGKQIHNHWTTKEVPIEVLLESKFPGEELMGKRSWIFLCFWPPKDKSFPIR